MMFVQWMILPLMVLFLVFNYLVGLLRNPDWGRITATNEERVLGETNLDDTAPPIEPYVWNGGGIISLWFDDAWVTQYTVAYPLIESYSMDASIAVPTGPLYFEAYL